MYLGPPISAVDLGGLKAAVIDVLTLAGDKITAVTAFILTDEMDPPAVFASFGLPAEVG